jgi:hypothetical protein
MSDGVGVYFQSLPIWYTPNAMGSDTQCIEANARLGLEWNEQNTGQSDASYTDEVYVDGTLVNSVAESLPVGAVQQRAYSIDSGLSAGSHTVLIVINTGDAVAEGYTQQTLNLCAE